MCFSRLLYCPSLPVEEPFSGLWAFEIEDQSRRDNLIRTPKLEAVCDVLYLSSLL